MKDGSGSKHQGLSNISKKSDDVAEYYDNWAADYDGTLSDWRYDAPEQVAAMLAAKLEKDSTILDVGCGTGLGGKALLTAGFKTVDGIDVSRLSLEVAGMTEAYRNLSAIDLQQLPLPIADDHYGGLACVGVLTYLTESISTLIEFSRIVRSGGFIAITQRTDLFAERAFASLLDELVKGGVITQVHISEPRPYLPNNEEFSDQILVHYIGFTVV